jgi:hypothetical protein
MALRVGGKGKDNDSLQYQNGKKINIKMHYISTGRGHNDMSRKLLNSGWEWWDGNRRG